MTQKPIGVRQITGVWSFLASVDWEEKWLWVLILFHILCLCITVMTLHKMNFQAVLFLLFLGVVFFSENINEYAARHWRSFSNQQYFDSQGLFISIILSAPILLNCLIIVIYWLYTTWNMLVHVKREKVKRALKRHQSQEDKDK